SRFARPRPVWKWKPCDGSVATAAYSDRIAARSAARSSVSSDAIGMFLPAWPLTRSAGARDRHRNRVAQDVEHRGGVQHMLLELVQHLPVGCALEAVAHPDLVETRALPVAEAEEGVQIEIAFQIEAQVLDIDATRGGVVGEADGQAGCQRCQDSLDGVGAGVATQQHVRLVAGHEVGPPVLLFRASAVERDDLG